MYIEDHSFHIPSPPFDGKVMNPLVLTSPSASAYRRQTSQSSIASSISTTTTSSAFFSYSPPPSPHSSYFSPVSSDHEDADEDEIKVSKAVDLHARAQLLLSLLYTKSFFDDASSPVLQDLIHPDCTFEVEHFDATTSTITSRDEYLRGWRQKVAALADITSRVRECCVDEGQRKVWVVNEMSCLQGQTRYRKESVDMLTFDSEGRMKRREGWLRMPKRRGDDE